MTGSLPGGPACATLGVCDHCALEKTAGEKPLVGNDGSKWWTRMPAAHWDEDDQWPKFACMSRDAFGARGTATVSAGDMITATTYMNADHSGLYRFELSCGMEATNAAFNASPITPWKALHVSKELAPGSPPLPAGREVGRTRAETDAYWARTVCTGAGCPYRMNGAQPQYPGGAYNADSGECQTGPTGALKLTCFIEDSFVIPPTSCIGPATLRWMWNSAEGPETYSNCLDLNFEASSNPGGPGGGSGGDAVGGGGGAGGAGGSIGGIGNSAGGGGDDTGGISGAAVGGVLFLLALGGAAYYTRTRKPAAPAVHVKTESPVQLFSGQQQPATPPPPPLPHAAEPPLPVAWAEMQDPTTQRAYYYNASTQESTWLRPTFV